ncbi:uncharacterized protein BX663DRAFT_513352 [Cokeromyces recurvatus]|uniref:uncharacterized protein n=1 Tax=Cokeromyces recurvatus TaxID=90255 RepID=UPI00221EFD85|nr:uncharacterized protein BX663DRAFT_513352 [Cokeromyces recurvatus]KAI7901582.1 hypothetical protein BX663DRAFT_513352 [Cokeromyces recurvatus]
MKLIRKSIFIYMSKAFIIWIHFLQLLLMDYVSNINLYFFFTISSFIIRFFIIMNPYYTNTGLFR